MKKSVIVLVVIALLVIIINSCSGETSMRNKVGSSQNWGPNHFWNSNTGSVEKKPWK